MATSTASSTAATVVEAPSLDVMLNNLVYILEAHKSHVRSRRDWALLFTHSYLLASEFAFAGLQQAEAEGAAAGSSRSPILPTACWSGTGQGEDIVLLYSRRGSGGGGGGGSHGNQQQQQQYALCLITMGSDLIVSLAHGDTALDCNLPAAMVAPVDASVEGRSGIDAIREAYPQVEQLHALLWEQLFSRLPFNQQRLQNQQQQRQQQQQLRQQRPIPMPHYPIPNQQHPTPQQPVPSPFDYGRADLDPFGGGVGGGGMRFDPLRSGPPHRPHLGGGGGGVILDPFSGRPLAPGAVPPGARFDPFGPPGPPDLPPGGGGGLSGRFDPDPDHLRPPGWDGGGGFGGGFGGGRGGRGSGGFGGGGFYI